MGSRSIGSGISSAVVEQKIRFRSDEGIDSYLASLEMDDEPYKVVDRYIEGGWHYLVIRKRYGKYPFLGEKDPVSHLTPAQKRRKKEAAKRKKEQLNAEIREIYDRLVNK